MTREIVYIFIVKPLLILLLYAIFGLVVVTGGLTWEGVTIALIIVLIMRWDLSAFE